MVSCTVMRDTMLGGNPVKTGDQVEVLGRVAIHLLHGPKPALALIGDGSPRTPTKEPEVNIITREPEVEQRDPEIAAPKKKAVRKKAVSQDTDDD